MRKREKVWERPDCAQRKENRKKMLLSFGRRRVVFFSHGVAGDRRQCCGVGESAQARPAGARAPPSRRRSGDGESGVGRSKRAKVVAAIAEAALLAVSGGKSRKTGFVLARAVLAESLSGVGVARERQAALVGKQFRKAEAVARETAVGMLATKQVPRRKESDDSRQQFKRKFNAWMCENFTAKVRAARERQPRPQLSVLVHTRRSSRCAQRLPTRKWFST